MHPRFFCPDLPDAGQDCPLPEAVAHHAERVLRLRVGEPIVLFDGEGVEAQAEIVRLGREAAAYIRTRTQVDREAPLIITLVQALATGDKMDWIVQKAVELGVSQVVPVAAERSVLRLEGERAAKRVAHWQQIAVSAAEQSGRNRILHVAPLVGLPQWLTTARGSLCWMLEPEAGERLSRKPRPEGAVSLLVGPEGGWSDRELAAARGEGCEAVALGPRVLRTETAGLAATAAMMALWGDY
ncbi:16S rRNA (uracil(1498)-N(3))-methyltransferase [Niveibacterium sp. SC-1]|uniref:16S rRNA (uracil(1498)-N(3))-methyltransferase n=1 Tax=Niveibacterium sp. SC-1 TaxID=3135646 RepID=UPI00311F7877